MAEHESENEEQPAPPPAPQPPVPQPPAPPPPPAAGPPAEAQRPAPMHMAAPPPSEAPPEGSAGPPPVPSPAESWTFVGGRSARTLPGSRFAKIGVAVGVIVLLIAVGVVFVLPKGGGGRALALGFQQGGDLTYRMSMGMDGSISIAGQSAPFRMQVNATVSMKVQSVDSNGNATVNVSIKNISFKSDPAVPYDTVPKTLDQTMVIAPDGRILEGGLGLSSVGAGGQTAPGWDQFAPLLPSEAVAPGDTWSQDTDVPLPFGDDTMHVSTESKLLAFADEDGREVAVVKTSTKVPFDFTVSLVDILKTTGESAEDVGIPAGSDLQIAYGGDMTMETTSRLDTTSKQLLGSVSDGTMNIKFHFENLPPEAGPDPGEATLTGTFTYSETKVAGEKAGAEPSPSKDEDAKAA